MHSAINRFGVVYMLISPLLMSAFTVTTTTTVTTFPAFAPVRSICYITYHHKICAAGREVDFFGGGERKGQSGGQKRP